jgi:hypothetical protein
MEFIRNNCAKLAVKEIADKLNRKEEPIAKFIQKNNLTTVNQTGGEDQRQFLRNRLERRYYWPGTKAQLINNKHINEVEMFINKWIDMVIQFKEDVLPTEEEQIKELILLSIQLDRVRIKEALNLQKIADLEAKLEIEYALTNPDIAKIDRWTNELTLANASSESCGVQIKNINNDLNKLYKDLKATRDMRFSKVDSGSKTFQNLIRKIQDEKEREQMAREIELMRMATEKKRIELYDYHKYGDGMIDRPILNSDSVKYKGNDNEKETVERPEIPGLASKGEGEGSS